MSDPIRPFGDLTKVRTGNVVGPPNPITWPGARSPLTLFVPDLGGGVGGGGGGGGGAPPPPPPPEPQPNPPSILGGGDPNTPRPFDNDMMDLLVGGARPNGGGGPPPDHEQMTNGIAMMPGISFNGLLPGLEAAGKKVRRKPRGNDLFLVALSWRSKLKRVLDRLRNRLPTVAPGAIDYKHGGRLVTSVIDIKIDWLTSNQSRLEKLLEKWIGYPASSDSFGITAVLLIVRILDELGGCTSDPRKAMRDILAILRAHHADQNDGPVPPQLAEDFGPVVNGAPDLGWKGGNGR